MADSVKPTTTGAEEPGIEIAIEVPDLPNGQNHIGVWSSGLFGCMKQPCNAIVTCFLPCWTFGRIANIVDNGGISCCISAMTCMGYCLCCICCGFARNRIPCKLTSQYRGRLRDMYRIRPSPAIDSLTHFFCLLCALCQEYRELQARNWDPSIGWKKNIQRNPQLTTMRPPVNQTMRPRRN